MRGTASSSGHLGWQRSATSGVSQPSYRRPVHRKTFTQNGELAAWRASWMHFDFRKILGGDVTADLVCALPHRRVHLPLLVSMRHPRGLPGPQWRWWQVCGYRRVFSLWDGREARDVALQTTERAWAARWWRRLRGTPLWWTLAPRPPRSTAAHPLVPHTAAANPASSVTQKRAPLPSTQSGLNSITCDGASMNAHVR